MDTTDQATREPAKADADENMAMMMQIFGGKILDDLDFLLGAKPFEAALHFGRPPQLRHLLPPRRLAVDLESAMIDQRPDHAPATAVVSAQKRRLRVSSGGRHGEDASTGRRS